MEMAKIKLNFIDEYVLAVVSGHGRGETNTMRLYESYPSWRRLSGGFTARVSAALDAGHQAADAGSASLTAPLCARACSRSEMPFPSNRHLALAYWWRMIFSESRYSLFGIMR